MERNLRYRTQQTVDEKPNIVLSEQTEEVSWFRRFYKWIIVINGDTDVVNGRGYQYIPEVTNYVFFFGGRFRTLKKDTFHLSLLVLFLMIVPMVLFSIFETHELWHSIYGYKVLVIFFYYFWTMSFAFFIRAATGDPGVLPRNIHLGQERNNFQTPQEYYNLILLPVNGTSNVHTDKHIELKYCTTCRIWRPPRAAHCYTCDACILVHDHHCVWINNCVGQRNYRYFIIFIVSAILAIFFLIANASIHLTRVTRPSKAPVAALLIVYGCIMVCYPMILLGYHIALTGTQQTTREFLREIGMKNPVFTRITVSTNNIFDKGSFFKNMFYLMCQARGPSVVSSREYQGPARWKFTKIQPTNTSSVS